MTAEPSLHRPHVAPRPKVPAAPRHLSPAARQWWRQIVTTFELEPHHLRLLEGAATSWDRAQEARLILEREGIVITDRFGQPKEHPAATTERQALIAFARLTRELGLDLAESEAPHPPTRWRGR